jgi:hypothetical protein
MVKGHKAPVTMRAVIARINRKLDGLKLKVSRGEMVRRESNYFLLHLKQNTITPLKKDIESYAREIGVLKEWEEIE